MPGGGGGSETQTSSEPWAQQQPFLEFGFGEAKDIYQNQTPEFFPGQTFTPFGQATQAGLGGMVNRATGGSPLEQGGQNQILSTLQGDWLNANPATQMYQPFASGQNVGANPVFGLGAGQAMGGEIGSNPLYGLLGNMAGGGEIGGNPYLDATFDKAASRVSDFYSQSTAPSTMAQFSAAGGGGMSSPALQEVQSYQSRQLGDTLNDLATNIYGGAYESDQARRMQAAGALGGAYGNEQQMRDAMVGQFGGAYRGGVGDQLGAIGGTGGLFGQERQNIFEGAFRAPSLSQDIDYGNLDQLLGAGGAFDAKSNEALQDQINRWNFDQQLPQNQLNQFMQLIAGNFGGTSTTTQSVESDPFGQALQVAGTAAMFAAMCWVAREVYGADNPKWLLFREWMLTKAPAALLNLYLQHGERAAAWLHNNPEHKPEIRAWMDRTLEEV